MVEATDPPREFTGIKPNPIYERSLVIASTNIISVHWFSIIVHNCFAKKDKKREADFRRPLQMRVTGGTPPVIPSIPVVN
jgi:hypothetical protein